jgi:G3E family GTPase
VSFLSAAEVSRLPVAVIGGYLGAGKTTLLNRLLAEGHGIKLAMLVNDFGSANIDAALIASRDGETISLTNGCICCTIGDNLGLTLHDLAERRDGPELIVIEASGVADPGKIAHYAVSHPRLVLDSIVVVADAETIRKRADDKYVGDLVRLQLAAADVIVLSKTDLVDSDSCKQARVWIAAEVPGARLLTTRDTGLFSQLLLTGGAGFARPAPASDDHGQVFATWSFSREQPLDGDALRAALAALPPAVVRAKGIVRLAEAPDRRFVLQVVGRRWSLEEGAGEAQESWPSARSVVVCIGPVAEFDRVSLEALFAPVAPAIAPPAIAALLQGEGRL